MQGGSDGLEGDRATSREAEASPSGPGPGDSPFPGPPPPPPPGGGWGAGPWSGAPGWAPPGWGGPPSWSAPPEHLAGPGPRQPGGRRRALFIAAAIVGALVIAGASGTVTALLVRGGSSPASAPPTAQPTPTPGAAATRAQAAYRQMLAAAQASSGYHYVSVSSTPGQPITHETITGDAGQKDGIQVITLSSTYGNERFTLHLTAGGSVYFQGNVPALEDQLGVVASSAAALDGRWILVSVGDGPYQQLEVGITVVSHLQGDPLIPNSLVTVHTAGGTVERVSGGDGGGGSAHFDVATGSKLPQTYAETATSLGFSATDTFSNWGTAPSVSTPSGAVSWSSLHTQKPAGGYGNGGVQGGTPSPGAATPTPSGGAA